MSSASEINNGTPSPLPQEPQEPPRTSRYPRSSIDFQNSEQARIARVAALAKSLGQRVPQVSTSSSPLRTPLSPLLIESSNRDIEEGPSRDLSYTRNDSHTPPPVVGGGLRRSRTTHDFTRISPLLNEAMSSQQTPPPSWQDVVYQEPRSQDPTTAPAAFTVVTLNKYFRTTPSPFLLGALGLVMIGTPPQRQRSTPTRNTPSPLMKENLILRTPTPIEEEAQIDNRNKTPEQILPTILDLEPMDCDRVDMDEEIFLATSRIFKYLTTERREELQNQKNN